MTTKNTYSGLALLVITMLLMSGQTARGQSRARTWDLCFRGTASGGELILMRTFNRSVEYVAIPTSPRESAKSVVARLADAINGYVQADTTSVSSDKHRLWEGDFLTSASGEALTLPGRYREYALAGTESGLGIPRPPTSLSCSLKGSSAVLYWINPPLPYDSISVQMASMKDRFMSYQRLPGSAETFTADMSSLGLDTPDIDVRVIGFRNGLPSSPGALHIGSFSQEELYGIPFTDNVAPNWKAWTNSDKADRSFLGCTERYPLVNRCLDVETLLTVPFYQTIKAAGNAGSHGIYRKFLGLTGGHTYRLTACVNTLDMDSAASPWSFAICATPNRPGGADLTAEQMAGSAALPNGARGPKAGIVASFVPGHTTKGQFHLAFSGEKDEGGNTVAHVTLPADANSITVWLRFSCSSSQGKVAFSGVMLEDITANPTVTPPDEVRKRAYKAEERLLRGIAGQLEHRPKQ
jgi:hypothetical protein